MNSTHDTNRDIVHMTVLMRVRPDRVAAFREGLCALIAPSRAEPGCISYDAHQDEADPTLFVMWERWRDMAALEAHAASPHFLAFEAAHGADLLKPIRESIHFHRRLPER